MTMKSAAATEIYIPEKKFLNGIKISTTIIYTILIIWGLATLFPLLWVFMNSFKSSSEILGNALALPKTLSFANYKALGNYEQINIFRGFLNSIIISGSVLACVTILGGMGAFAISRFKFKLSGVIKVILFASMLVPQFAVIVPGLRLINTIGLNNTYLAVIIPHVAGFLNFSILIVSGFMATLPVELEEAAIMDGCSIPRIFFKIILPLSKPALATAGIMVFLWSYNDLLLSLVYLTGTLRPICVLLTMVSSLYGTNYGAQMAAVVITVIPVLILYVISQEYVIKGLIAGAVKG